MNIGLQDRVALVTGAAGGIGLAVAQALGAEGALVVASDVSAERLANVAADLPEGVVPVAADMTAPDVGSRLVRAALEAHGHLDVLVTAAGVYDTSTVGELAVDAWDRVHDVNLRGAFLCAQAALPSMIERRWGRIVTVSSVAAFTGGSVSASTAYVTSKAGVVAMTKSLARAAGPHGVTVNCVVPGTIDTPMIESWDADRRRAVDANTPLGRPGRAAEVAAMIVMLCAEAASYVTGAHLTVAGGLVMD